jgi:hypothetical protein
MRIPTQRKPVRRRYPSLSSLLRAIGTSQGCTCQLSEDGTYCEPDEEHCPPGVLAVCGDPPNCPCNCGGAVPTAVMVQAVLDAYSAAAGG